ncbi:MAG: serine hydrolase domain-containing protein [Bacteroidota bacterium]
MKKIVFVFVVYFFSLPAALQQTQARQLYFPPDEGSEWETTPLTDLAWCAHKLPALYDLLEENGTKSFLVLKDGRMVIEQYFNGHAMSQQWAWFSAGKSLRAVLVGLAQENGLLNISDPTSDYLGAGWTSLPAQEELRITIRDQLSMTSGLNEQFFACVTPNCLRSGSESGAGSRWAYHNGPYNLLKNVLEEAGSTDINTLTDRYIKQKIGMSTGNWIPNGNNTFFVSTARDMARFGLLILGQGSWSCELLSIALK